MTTTLPAALAAPTMRAMHQGHAADARAAGPAGAPGTERPGAEGPRAWLTALAHGRDATAWSRLIAGSAPELHRLAARILGDAAAADDAIQEVFLAVRDGAGRFRPWTADADADAVRWLRRITVHVCCHQLRGESRRAQRHRRAAGESPGRAEHRGASDRLIAQEQASLVRRALAALPTQMRDAIVAHHLDGGTYQDVAREHGCPVGTVKARVSRGLEAMRMSLARSGVALSVAGLGNGIAALPGPGAKLSAHAMQHLLRPLLRSNRTALLPLKGALPLSGPLAALAGIAACGAAALVAAFVLRGAPAPPPSRAPAAAPPPAVAAVVPALQALPDGVSGALVVHDLSAALDRLQAVAAAVAHASGAPAPSLRSSIFSLLGAQAFASDASGACVFIMPASCISTDGVVLLTSRSPAAVCAAATAGGCASVADGPLVQIAAAPRALLPRGTAAAEYAQLSTMAADDDCELVFSPRRIVAAKGAAARSSVQGYLPLIALAAAQKLGGEAVTIARATLLATDITLAQAADMETVGLELRLDAREVTITATVRAVAGGPLERHLQPIAADPDQDAAMRARVGPDAGMLAIVGRCPVAPWLRYMMELEATVHDAAERDVIPAPLRDAASSFLSRMDGSMAGAYRIGADGKARYRAAYAVADTASAHLDAQALWNGILTGSAVPRMLATRNEALTYIPNGARVRAADGAEYPVDLTRTGILPGLPAAQAAAMQAAMQPPSYTAYLPHCLLQAQDSDELEAMARPGSSLLAVPPAPGGWVDADGVAWCDLPMFVALGAQELAIDSAAARGVAPTLTAIAPSRTPPAVAAWRVGAGQLQARVALPVEGLAAIVALLKPHVDAQLDATPPLPAPKHEF